MKRQIKYFKITGNHMDDGTIKSICDGDLILCEKVNNWMLELDNIQSLFVIDCIDGLFLSQIIDYKKQSDFIICHYYNTIYKDFSLEKKDIIDLYKITNLLSRNLNLSE